MILAAHQSAYLPGPRLLHKIAAADQFVVLDHLPHSHNSFENRNKIRTSQGEQWLTVPVVHGAASLSETQVVPGTWTRKHYRALEMNYSRAPFWKVYKGRFDYRALAYAPLTNLAMDSTVSLAEAFGMKLSHDVPCSCKLKPEGDNWRMILSLCRKLNADTFLFGGNGRDYMTQEAREAFLRAGVKPLFQEWTNEEYRQCYPGFIPNLSAVDILLNLGPVEGRELIMRGGRWEE